MRQSATTLLGVTLALALAPAANASFGIAHFEIAFSGPDGSPVTQAAAHPFELATSVHLNEDPDPRDPRFVVPAGEVKDLIIHLPAGTSLDPGAAPICPAAGFLAINPVTETPDCPDSTALGAASFEVFNPGAPSSRALFNLAPPPGVLAKFGFVVSVVPVTVEVLASPERPDETLIRTTNTLQATPVFGVGLTLWGDPASPAHDAQRGACIAHPHTSCPVTVPQEPLLSLPTRCGAPLQGSYEADSWADPGALRPDGKPELSDPAWATGSAETQYPGEPAIPIGLSGCAILPFAPRVTAKPTTLAAGSPSGLDFSIDLNDEGIDAPAGLAASQIEAVVVRLPEGFSINPSLAAGLGVCTEAELARESAFSAPGAGCPDAAKIGSAEALSPILRAPLKGSLFIAKPYQNPFGSLIAIYLVLANPGLGINVVVPLKVESDPITGRLTTIAPQLPQLPFSHLGLHFREGARSPLASPPACGAYSAQAELTPYSGTSPISATSAFGFSVGPGGGPCPAAGLPPFRPGLVAGTINNAAGRFSPFYLRLSRDDTEQEITHFSIKLPPGVAAKLAGIPSCPEAAIAAAKARTGPHGGQEEIESPSCPAGAQVGRTLAGFGVGAALAYAPGALYLAGPYHGSALSLVAITAGRIGPFDLGTVVVREAFRIDPESGEAFIDASGSDPIPHIIRGIPVHLRDIRAYVERPDFVLNPSSCRRTSTASTLLGAGLDFGSGADDRPVTVSSPFQAADCAALPFAPRLSLALKGGARRGEHPAFKATLKMAGIGEAGVAGAQLTLPRSEFIANSHFKTICTRVAFNSGNSPGEGCPPGSIYGHAKAITPLLSEPLAGPILLRSSEQQLPDVIAALRGGGIDVVLRGRLDSVAGRLRASFRDLPDAPLQSASFALFGAGKGLFENSTDLCRGAYRAEVSLLGQNGKRRSLRPRLKASCERRGGR